MEDEGRTRLKAVAVPAVVLGAAAAMLLVLAFIGSLRLQALESRVSAWSDLLAAIALAAAAVWAIYTWAREKEHQAERLTYDQLNSFYDLFLGEELLAHRRAIAAHWSKSFDGALSPSTLKLPQCGSTPSEIQSAVAEALGLRFSVPTSDEVRDMPGEILRSTEFLCNRFEHLGKLVGCGAVRKEVIQIFFNTLLADTFLLVLPYICFRREKKLPWALRFQGLAEEFPSLSRDPLMV